MDKFNLVDIWREKHPSDKIYTWSNKTGYCKSRIDFWLISKNLNKEVVEVEVCPTPLTDHKAIHIKLNLCPSKLTTHSIYWKLNNSLLKDDEVKKEADRLISLYWFKANEENCFGRNWELLKFELGQFFRKTGSIKAKLKREEEVKLVSRISSLSYQLPNTLSHDEKLELANLQVKLDDLYTQSKGCVYQV